MVFIPPLVEEINPLTLACGPAVVAVTVTVILQVPLAASAPPLKEIVLGAVVVSVPPHCDEDPEAIVSPEGKESVKVTPVKSTPTSKFGLVSVKVSVETPLTATGLGEKALVICGGLGTAQPVTLTLSRSILLLPEFAPNALILKDVVVEPVAFAGNGTEVLHVDFSKVSVAGVVAVYAPPALDQTYIKLLVTQLFEA